jgi:hypothetical protein
VQAIRAELGDITAELHKAAVARPEAGPETVDLEPPGPGEAPWARAVARRGVALP